MSLTLIFKRYFSTTIYKEIKTRYRKKNPIIIPSKKDRGFEPQLLQVSTSLSSLELMPSLILFVEVSLNYFYKQTILILQMLQIKFLVMFIHRIPVSAWIFYAFSFKF